MIFHAGVSEGLPGVSPRSVMYGPRSHVFNGPSAPYEYVFQSVARCSELARKFRESVGEGHSRSLVSRYSSWQRIGSARPSRHEGIGISPALFGQLTTMLKIKLPRMRSPPPKPSF